MSSTLLRLSLPSFSPAASIEPQLLSKSFDKANLLLIQSYRPEKPYSISTIRSAPSSVCSAAHPASLFSPFLLLFSQALHRQTCSGFEPLPINYRIRSYRLSNLATSSQGPVQSASTVRRGKIRSSPHLRALVPEGCEAEGYREKDKVRAMSVSRSISLTGLFPFDRVRLDTIKWGARRLSSFVLPSADLGLLVTE